MKMKCEYCAAMIDSTMDKCPNCGAVNSNVVRVTKSTPRTIEELKEWYRAHNLPPSNVTRFFIGENYQEPKAFGIYQEGEQFIVYKNKDTGERAIRYQGTDEAYAVNELYLKLKSEILNQKAHSASLRGSQTTSKANKFKGRFFSIVFVLFWIVLLTNIVSGFIKGKPHYYKYDDTVYVQYYDAWYGYDDFSNDYYYVYRVPTELSNNAVDYEYDVKGLSWDEYSTFTEFKDSDYYNDNLKSTNDSDSDYDWDSGSDSWDSGSTDWGSDW